MTLNGRSKPEVVVVTGASAGVGRATVREFAKRQAWIGLIARGLDGLEGARREVEAAGGRALVLQADVADAAAVEQAAARVEQELGPSMCGSTTRPHPSSRRSRRCSRKSSSA